MNQFANIGSMFPGAQNKAIRDKLKQLLTMPGNRQVTGLVLTDEKKDTMIVNGESASVTFFRLDPHGPKTLEAKWLDTKCWNGCQSLVFKHEAERVLGIAQSEFAYWKKVCDEDPGGYGIEGMAAAANIVAAITMGISVEDFKAGKADYERVSEPAGNEPVERDALVPALKAVKHVLEALALSGPETHAHYRLMARRLLDEHVNPALAPKGGAQ